MAKVHDKFVIELAEVIKGYGNDPDVDDPFHLSEFYRFYELPEIAVSANHFKTMIPLEVEKAKGRKTCSLECLRCKQTYDYSWDTMDEISYTMYSYCPDCIRKGIQLLKSQGSEVEILSTIRSRYNCFDETEESIYHALSDAIKLIAERREG